MAQRDPHRRGWSREAVQGCERRRTCVVCQREQGGKGHQSAEPQAGAKKEVQSRKAGANGCRDGRAKDLVEGSAVARRKTQAGIGKPAVGMVGRPQQKAYIPPGL